MTKPINCHACQDKGYYTQFVGKIGADDFGGEGYVTKPSIKKFPCPKCQPEQKECVACRNYQPRCKGNYCCGDSTSHTQDKDGLWCHVCQMFCTPPQDRIPHTCKTERCPSYQSEAQTEQKDPLGGLMTEKQYHEVADMADKFVAKFPQPTDRLFVLPSDMKKKLKAEWKQYLADNPSKKRTIGHHHYFRTRYASKYWLKKIAELLTKPEHQDNSEGLIERFFVENPGGEHMINGKWYSGKYGCDTIEMLLEAQHRKTREDTIREFNQSKT